jgi:hypothetical protein
MNASQVSQMIAETLEHSLSTDPYELDSDEANVALVEWEVDGGAISLKLGLWFYDRDESRKDVEPDETLEASVVISVGQTKEGTR